MVRNMIVLQRRKNMKRVIRKINIPIEINIEDNTQFT